MAKNHLDETTKRFILDFIDLINGNLDDRTLYEKWKLNETKKSEQTETELEQRLNEIENILQEIKLCVV